MEVCDDGNEDDGDGCIIDCSLVSCGDGVVQLGEECDDGNVNNTDACLSICLNARCGDGFVRVDVPEFIEVCDDGN